MIAQIFAFILSIFNFIIMLIIRLVMSVFPSLGLENLYSVFETFFNLCTGAMNFTYFMLGDVAPLLVDIVIILFSIKHLVLPIINFCRRALVK